MNKTFDMEEVYNKMSCFTVVDANFVDRCSLAESLAQCKHIMNFFKYYEIMYCLIQIRSKSTELCVIFIFMVIVVLLMILIGHLVSKYFAPTLKIIAVKLKMNEYLAGVTLLAFGNISPDLMANLMPIRSHAPLFTITISNALAIILLSGGMICYLKSFKINGPYAVRDLLILLLSCELVLYMAATDKEITIDELSVLIVVYVVDLIIVITDIYLVRVTIKKLRKEIRELIIEPDSPERSRMLAEKSNLLRELNLDQILVIRYHPTTYSLTSNPSFQLSGRRATFDGFFTTKHELPAPKVDADRTRNLLYVPSNRRNRGLWMDFLTALSPISIEEWKQQGLLKRAFTVLMCPIVLPCSIFIPVVDYSCKRHGWSKLLNCSQIITNPFICITLAEAMFVKEYQRWRLTFDFTYAIWSLCLTVPLAIVVFVTTRTDRPPAYHILFVLLNTGSTMLMIIICATELEVLCCIVAVVFDLSESFVACTIRSFSAAMADLIMNMEIAMQGYERMAFAATLAGPFVSIAISLAVPLYFHHQLRYKGNFLGDLGTNCYYFFLIAIFSTIGWTLTFNFHARRSAAVFGFVLYILFVLYSVLVEAKLIHEFGGDSQFEPI